MNRITITGSTVGAIAVGAGATAHSGDGGASDEQVFALTIDVREASRQAIATWLRAMAARIEDGTSDEDSYAEARGKPSFAMALGPSNRFAHLRSIEDSLVGELKSAARLIADQDPAAYPPGTRLLDVALNVLRRHLAGGGR